MGRLLSLVVAWMASPALHLPWRTSFLGQLAGLDNVANYDSATVTPMRPIVSRSNIHPQSANVRKMFRRVCVRLLSYYARGMTLDATACSWSDSASPVPAAFSANELARSSPGPSYRLTHTCLPVAVL
jgi:hypothetical protein